MVPNQVSAGVFPPKMFPSRHGNGAPAPSHRGRVLANPVPPRGPPIAYLFDQNRDPVAADRISPAPTPDEEYRRDGSANPPTT